MQNSPIVTTDAEVLARQLYRALKIGDQDALTALLHEKFVGVTTEGLPLGLGGTYVSPGAMRRDFWGRIAHHYNAWAEPIEFRVLDDGQMLVLGRYTGKSKESGAVLDAAFAHVLRFDDGKIVHLEQFTDSQHWSDALTGGKQPLSVIQFEITDGLARICLNRPEANNAIDVDMARDLAEVATRCAENPEVRAVLLCANGARFTTGGDLAFLGGLPREELPNTLRRMIDDFHLAITRFTDLAVPVVCAVRGAAAGGGLGLLYCSDIVIAGEDCRFALGFGALGLTPDGGNTWFLPRLVGPRRAAALFLQQQVLTGVEAEQWGLTTQTVPDAKVDEVALAIARKLANGPTRAFANARRLLRDSWTASLPDQLAAERNSLTSVAATLDATEGISAFTAKRTPQFHGR